MRWRSGHSRILFSRPIMQAEFPKLINALKEDGLHCDLTEDGLVWTVNEYILKPSSIKKKWELSQTQFKRLCQYIYENDW